MRADGLVLLVGTSKGAFRLLGDPERTRWQVQGPFCDGWPINHVIGDAESATLWAGGGSAFHGAGIWRSEDGGESWEALRDGLPQEGCFFTVLRQAMAGDARTPAGVYFGTNSGSVFASIDEGDTWREVARHLPTILSLEALDRG